MISSNYIQLSLIFFTGLVAMFCLILARRVRKLNDLEAGLGGAIAVMAVEINRLENAISAAKSEATSASEALIQEIERAKNERAYWILQGNFSDPARATQPRTLRRKRREVTDVA